MRCLRSRGKCSYQKLCRTERKESLLVPLIKLPRNRACINGKYLDCKMLSVMRHTILLELSPFGPNLFMFRWDFIKPGFHYTANATTTTQKESDYKVEKSFLTLIVLF